MGAAMWALMGWCGTKYPGWWRHPNPPDPEPWWRVIIEGAIGAGAAVVVGNTLGGGLADAGLAGVALAGFATGAVAKDIVGGAFGAIRK